MSTTQQSFEAPTGRGFVSLMLDIPFGIGLPNGGYKVYDPVKGIAIVQITLREGSRSFFRGVPISSPTPTTDPKNNTSGDERPRQEYNYLLTSMLADGTEKATLKINSGVDGGFTEAKYFSEMQVTFLENDLSDIDSRDSYLLRRTTDILNPFLDKYRLLVDDYRITHVSADRNYYLAICYTSPLTTDELALTTERFFEGLRRGRTFYHTIGHGASNIIRVNSLDHLGPWPQVTDEIDKVFATFAQSDYEMPLSYDLIMQAIRSLQIDRDPRLAIVHAATAVEVHVLHILHQLLIALGRSSVDAWNILESDQEYEGVNKRLKRLELHTKEYCNQNKTQYVQFVGGTLYGRWSNVVARQRNRAVHAGVASFVWAEGVEAIGITKETIAFLDQRLPALANPVQLNPSVKTLRESAGGVLF